MKKQRKTATEGAHLWIYILNLHRWRLPTNHQFEPSYVINQVLKKRDLPNPCHGFLTPGIRQLPFSNMDRFPQEKIHDLAREINFFFNIFRKLLQI